MNIAIVFAGGTGTRMGAGIPKQFLDLDGKPILIYTLENFQNTDLIDKIYISCKEGYIDKTKKLIQKYKIDKVAEIVEGGSSSQESIFNALKVAQEQNDEDSIVLIHDGVRPFLSENVIQKNIDSVKEHGSAITCTACYETIIISEDKMNIDEAPKRDMCFTAQAPQSFYLKDIYDAHIKIREQNPTYTNIVDSCTLYRVLGKNVSIIEGDRGNIKVTTPQDFYILKALLEFEKNKEILGL